MISCHETFRKTFLKNNCDILLISFCSADINGTLRTSQEMNTEWLLWFKNIKVCDIIFITPNKQDWYSESRKDITEYLHTLIADVKYKRILTFGASMGGFASLLFGSILKADSIISINPQTNISLTCDINKDTIYNFPIVDDGDLTYYIYDNSEIVIYCCNNEYDRKQIDYFAKKIQNVKIEKINTSYDHGFIIDYSNEEIQEMIIKYLYPIINKFINTHNQHLKLLH